MTMTNEIEIMAPAGSWASLKAAIQGGADSIYFGVGKLNMRAKAANNFTLEDLPEIASLTRQHGIKTYLTLNTVLYDEDLPAMEQTIEAVKAAGITAIIASDQAAIMYANKQGVNVHISTQTNISNIGMVEFYSNFADVMVLARELNLDQVAAIVKEIKERHITGPSGKLVQIEVFAHGALCMAVSGKCYLSLHTYNSSANRGACRQSCRQGYTVTNSSGVQLDIDNEYIMSPKDLCTIDFLDKILGAGVTVLKLEGRGRSPEYVKTVTHCYKQAAGAVLDGSYTPERAIQWKEELEKVFNRGFWDGYYLGRKLGEWSPAHGSVATKRKVFAGKVLHYYPEAEVAHIRVKATAIHKGAPVIIIGDTSGVVEEKVESVWVDDKPATVAEKGQECTIPIHEKVRKNDKVYVWEDRE